ncbi:MAG: hypothetical protein QXE80_03450 [Pyrobaculum sp.]
MPVYRIDGTEVGFADGTFVLQPPNNNFLRFVLERARQKLVIPALPDSSSLSLNFLFDSQHVPVAIFCSGGNYTILFEETVIQIPAQTLVVDSLVSPLGNFSFSVTSPTALVYARTGQAETIAIEAYFESPGSSLTLILQKLDDVVTEYSSVNSLATLAYELDLSAANTLDFLLNTPTGMLSVALSESGTEYQLAVEFGAGYVRAYGETSYAEVNYLTRHFRIQIVNWNEGQYIAFFAAGTLLLLEQLPQQFVKPTIRFVSSDASGNSIYIYKRSLLPDTGTDLTQINPDGTKLFSAGTVFHGLTSTFTLGSDFSQPFYLTFYTDIETIQVQVGAVNGFVAVNSQSTTLKANVSTRVPFRISGGKLVYFNGLNEVVLGNANLIYRVTVSAPVNLLAPIGYANANVVQKNSSLRFHATDYALLLLPQYSTGQLTVTNPNTLESMTVSYGNAALITFNNQSYSHPSNFAQMLVNMARPTIRSLYFVSLENNTYHVSTNLLQSASSLFAINLSFDSDFVVFEGRKIVTALAINNNACGLNTANRQQNLQMQQITNSMLTRSLNALALAAAHKKHTSLPSSLIVGRTVGNSLAQLLETVNVKAFLYQSVKLVANGVQKGVATAASVGHIQEIKNALGLTVGRLLRALPTNLLAVGTHKSSSAAGELKTANFRTSLQSSVKRVSNTATRLISTLVGILNKLREDISRQFSQVEAKGKAPIVQLDRMVSAVFATGELLAGYLANLSYVFNKTLNVFVATNAKTIQSQRLAPTVHEHNQYVKLTEPASSSYKLAGSTNIATKYHTHNYVQYSSLVDINGIATYIIEKAYSLAGKVKDVLALKKHSHPYEKKRVIRIGNSEFSVATAASLLSQQTAQGAYLVPPEQVYAQARHSHGNTYARRGNPVNKAKAIKNGSLTFGVGNVAVALAPRNHKHANYDVSNIKSKITHLTSTDNINKLGATLLRYRLPTDSVSYRYFYARNLPVRLQYLLNKTIPPENIYSNTPLWSQVYIYVYLWAAKAFRYFSDNDTTEFQIRFMNYSMLAQALRRMGINLSFGEEVHLRIRFYRKHYGYFVQQHSINYNFPGYPIYSFAAPFAYAPPATGVDTLQLYINEIIEPLNTYYPHTLQLLRLILGLNPVENLPKDPAQVISFGIATMSPNRLDVINGGMPYNVLVLSKRG